jgi:hypothetical protein
MGIYSTISMMRSAEHRIYSIERQLQNGIVFRCTTPRLAMVPIKPIAARGFPSYE